MLRARTGRTEMRTHRARRVVSGEREKDIEPLRSNATTTRGRLRGAGKIQHSWNALVGSREAPRAPRSVVSLLSLLLFAFVISACASSAPGTIGALLGKTTEGRLFVRGIPPGQGADRAGLEIDDEILAIDGQSVKGMSQDDVRKAVRGNVGSTLTLTVDRGGHKRDVKVQRSPILAEKPEKSEAGSSRP
ncbi:MAG: hypothetical protein JWO86_3012 [Myxococcaceae bacterium]|nr:hypothetical protein [Myxococcaceae bacterium]